ncbi:uncharacterized protein BDR25DRAFT_344887 [Lindgomyces ingoldianus]|uniref:Uncharacterized protein n=1 Tax=Lindgomyces ingoldianus TaxID=673940 RepID=A0ACB6QN41_9PLEO|nr:uncharacterized protein BDR25DRAFT_344887 [Lindgomyces ingoldianus]KAF2467525.1 hypothetical protein BDR25DRAFT_344887 [Lindgomyces ingoldianus]
MSFVLTAEAKATMRANLELELAARKEKLLAMYDAQVASLRSRLERRVNRIPNNKRNMKIMDLLDPTASKATSALSKAPAINSKRTRPVARPAPTRTAAAPSAPASLPPGLPPQQVLPRQQAESRQQTEPRPQTQSRQQIHPQQIQPSQPTQSRKQAPIRGVKRSSNEMASDKENMADHQLSIPKKRARAAAPRNVPVPRNPRVAAADPAPVRTTRAASRKLAAPEVLSPKSSNARANSRTIAQTRARRPR